VFAARWFSGKFNFDEQVFRNGAGRIADDDRQIPARLELKAA
jgi:hypothetical protein